VAPVVATVAWEKYCGCRDDQFVVTSVADASVDDGAWF
jgi:hypothetical protein